MSSPDTDLNTRKMDDPISNSELPRKELLEAVPICSLEGRESIIQSEAHVAVLATDQLPVDSVPTTDQLPTDSVPTTDQLPTDSVPTTDQLPTDSVPTTDQLLANSGLAPDPFPVDSVPTTDQRTVDSVLTTDQRTVDSVLAPDPRPVDSVPTTDQLPADSVPTTNHLLVDSVPTTDQLPVDSVSTTDQLPADSVPTTDQLPTDSVLATDQLPANSVLAPDPRPADSVPTTDQLPADSVLTTDQLPADSVLTTDQLPSDSVLTTDQLPAYSLLQVKEENIDMETEVFSNRDSIITGHEGYMTVDTSLQSGESLETPYTYSNGDLNDGPPEENGLGGSVKSKWETEAILANYWEISPIPLSGYEEGTDWRSRCVFPDTDSFFNYKIAKPPSCCPYCTRTLKTKFRKVHIALHKSGKGFPCPLCTGLFTSEENVRTHLRMNICTNAQCGYSNCGATFISERHRAHHESVDHKNMSVFACRTCGLLCSKPSSAEAHYSLEHARKRKAAAPVIPHVSVNKIARKTLKPRRQTRSVSVSRVDSSLTLIPARSDNTMTDARPDKPKQNTYKNGSVRRQPLIEQVLSVKSGQKNRAAGRCYICSKDCRTKALLAEHLITHTGSAPYKCSATGCSEAFRTPDLLCSHLHTHVEPNTLVHSSLLQCDSCHGYWNSHEELLSHACGSSPRQANTKTSGALVDLPGVYQCEYCVKYFSSDLSRSQHYRAHIGSHLFHCGECAESFALVHDLACHVRSHCLSQPGVLDSRTKDGSHIGTVHPSSNLTVELASIKSIPLNVSSSSKAPMTSTKAATVKKEFKKKALSSLSARIPSSKARSQAAVIALKSRSQAPIVKTRVAVHNKNSVRVSKFLKKMQAIGKTKGKNQGTDPLLTCTVCGLSTKNVGGFRNHIAMHDRKGHI